MAISWRVAAHSLGALSCFAVWSIGTGSWSLHPPFFRLLGPSFFWGGSSVPPSPFLQKRKLKLKFVRVKTRNLRTYLLLHHEQTILSRFDRRGRHKLLSSTHRCGSYKSDSSAIEIAFVSVALEGIASTTDASNAAGFIVIIQASQARQHGHGMRYLSGLRLEDVSR